MCKNKNNNISFLPQFNHTQQGLLPGLLPGMAAPGLDDLNEARVQLQQTCAANKLVG